MRKALLAGLLVFNMQETDVEVFEVDLLGWEKSKVVQLKHFFIVLFIEI